MDPTTAPSPSEALCEICSSQPAKYTCPRCHVKSCSLACSRTHKTTTACSGQRDKAAYVPMKDYGYGKMMDDYVFLEDGKRKAEQWSKEIVGLKMGTDRSTMEGNASGPRQAVLSSKTLALQQALREKGMFVDFLPEGMERRRRNQSHYNPKSRHLQISMEFRYPSPGPTDSSGTNTDAVTQTSSSATSSSSGPPIPSYQMQNIPLNDTTSLQRIYAAQARRIPTHYPINTENETTGDEIQDLVFAMKVYHPSGFPLPAPTLDHSPPTYSTLPSASPSRGKTSAERYYTPLPPSAPLDSALKGTSFVEYPTIDVFLRRHWDQLVNTGKVAVFPVHQVVEHEKDDTAPRHGQERLSVSRQGTEQAVKRKHSDDDDDDDVTGGGADQIVSTSMLPNDAKKPRVEEAVVAAESALPSVHDEASTSEPTTMAVQETLVPVTTKVAAENGDLGKVSGLLSLDYGSDSD